MSAILMGIFRLALALPAVIPHIPLSLRVSMPWQKWKGQSCWGDILSEERSMPVSPSHERTSRSSWPGSPSEPKAHYSICCSLWGKKGGSGKSFIEIVSSTGPHVSTMKALRSSCFKELWLILFNTFPFHVAAGPLFSISLYIPRSGVPSTHFLGLHLAVKVLQMEMVLRDLPAQALPAFPILPQSHATLRGNPRGNRSGPTAWTVVMSAARLRRGMGRENVGMCAACSQWLRCAGLCPAGESWPGGQCHWLGDSDGGHQYMGS